MDIINLIPEGSRNAIGRADLAIKAGMTDRMVRREIQEAKEKGEIILNTMDGNGYFRPVFPEDTDWVKAQYRANQARIISMSIQQKHLRILMREQDIEF